MGMYDCFYDANGNEAQLDSGPCGLLNFYLGNYVGNEGFKDGIHFSKTGDYVVVINEGVFVAMFGQDAFRASQLHMPVDSVDAHRMIVEY